MIKNLFLSIFEISVSTSLIVFVLLMLAPILNKRYASKWNYYIWIVLGFRLIIPLNGSFPLREIVINVPPKMAAPIIANTGIAIPATLQTGERFTGITVLDFIAVIWLVVCVCFLSVHIFSFLHYKTKILRAGTYVEGSLILDQLLKLQKDLQITAKIAVIKYSGAESPMIIGFFQPVLVLPDAEYSQEDLFFILKHELVHLKHHDIYFKLLFVITTALHWFNPLIYLMKKEAYVAMELSCDERVIQGTAYAVRKAYTEALFAALHKQCKKETALTTQFYGGNQVMKKRFKNILAKSKKKNGFSVLVCAASITLVLGMITGCSIMEPSPSKKQADRDFQKEEPTDHANMQAAPTETQEPEKPEADNTKNPEDTLSADGQAIKHTAENFVTAYFSADMDAIQDYLTNPYEWDMNVYTGTSVLSDFTLKGLTNIGEEEIGSIQVVSVEYKDSRFEDTFLYLTLEFVKQEDGWKIQFYGTEA